MKKFLPKSFNNPSGFTLIELMVVIAIIGILAVVALGIFSGAQGSARDARRVAEIDSLAKNIESTRDPATREFTYNSTTMATDYPGSTAGLADPTANYVYCYAVATSVSNLPVDPVLGAWSGTACPNASYLIIGGTDGTRSTTVTAVAGAGNDLSDGVAAWKVCAWLERSQKSFCKTNVVQ